MIDTAEKTTTELILYEFDNCKGTKTAFIKHMAEKFGRNAQGVKNNWFYGLQIFPKDEQEKILKEAKLYNHGTIDSK